MTGDWRYNQQWRREHREQFQAQKKRHNDRSRVLARWHYGRWTAKEDELLMQSGLSDQALVDALGRTRLALIARRHRLRSRDNVEA